MDSTLWGYTIIYLTILQEYTTIVHTLLKYLLLIQIIVNQNNLCILYASIYNMCTKLQRVVVPVTDFKACLAPSVLFYCAFPLPPSCQYSVFLAALFLQVKYVVIKYKFFFHSQSMIIVSLFISLQRRFLRNKLLVLRWYWKIFRNTI